MSCRRVNGVNRCCFRPARLLCVAPFSLCVEVRGALACCVSGLLPNELSQLIASGRVTNSSVKMGQHWISEVTHLNLNGISMGTGGKYEVWNIGLEVWSQILGRKNTFVCCQGNVTNSNIIKPSDTRQERLMLRTNNLKTGFFICGKEARRNAADKRLRLSEQRRKCQSGI